MKTKKKSCLFIASLIDDENRLSRKWSNSLLKNIVSPALTKTGYLKPVSLKKDVNWGLENTQIIKQLIETDLVIADLTGNHPDVYYALAIRHVSRKPTVHLIRKGERLSFNLDNIHPVRISVDLEKSKTDINRLSNQIVLAEKKQAGLVSIEEYTEGKDMLSGHNISMTQENLFDVLANILSSIKVLEGQLSKIDSKVNVLRGEIQLATQPSPFVERRLAKYESIKYKVQQKGLIKNSGN